MIVSEEAMKELKALYLDLQEEVETLEVINDATMEGCSEKGRIFGALNGSVKRLRKLMDRADALESEITRG